MTTTGIKRWKKRDWGVVRCSQKTSLLTATASKFFAQTGCNYLIMGVLFKTSLWEFNIRGWKAHLKIRILYFDTVALGKKIKGRKEYIVVDTLELPMTTVIHLAIIYDSKGAIPVIKQLVGRFSGLKKLLADGGYRGPLAEFIKGLGWDFEVVLRPLPKNLLASLRYFPIKQKNGDLRACLWVNTDCSTPPKGTNRKRARCSCFHCFAVAIKDLISRPQRCQILQETSLQKLWDLRKPCNGYESPPFDDYVASFYRKKCCRWQKAFPLAFISGLRSDWLMNTCWKIFHTLWVS